MSLPWLTASIQDLGGMWKARDAVKDVHWCPRATETPPPNLEWGLVTE